MDAAVAVAFALAVVHPEAGNIGGGGYMLVRMTDGTVRAFDYKETAPAAAHPGMFKTRLDATVGYQASAVPGTVAGMAMAHARFGKLPWRAVLEPARRLARERLSRVAAHGIDPGAAGAGDEAVSGLARRSFCTALTAR